MQLFCNFWFFLFGGGGGWGERVVAEFGKLPTWKWKKATQIIYMCNVIPSNLIPARIIFET